MAVWRVSEPVFELTMKLLRGLGRALRRSPQGKQLLALGLAISIECIGGTEVSAEDHVDYKYEVYGEEKGRIQIHTHSALFETALDSRFSIKGQLIFDAISGATPTGIPTLPTETPATTVVPLATSDSRPPAVSLRDDRRAGFIQPELHWGRHTFAPQYSYSDEHDYTSRGLAYTHSVALNEKNTTLSFGASYTSDVIHPTTTPGSWFGDSKHKDTYDFLIGINQILTKTTVLSANLTLGTSSGYHADPYKRFAFMQDIFDYVDGAVAPTYGGLPLADELRPGHRTRQVLHLAVNQYMPKVNAGAELAYRFSHDSFGIVSHTAEAIWNQKFTQRVIFSPLFRYYQQSAADFYHTSLPGARFDLDTPEFYSADYRLSKMRSLTYGASLSFRVQKWLSLDVAVKRYTMHGLDGITEQGAYPAANIYTGGVKIIF